MNEELNEMYERFQKQLEAHIQEMWNINEEVSESGRLFTRARMKEYPMEIINSESGVFQLNMN